MSQALVVTPYVRIRTALQVVLRTLPSLTRVDTAANVEPALQMIQQFPYDLTVVDAALGAQQVTDLVGRLQLMSDCTKVIIIVGNKVEEQQVAAAQADRVLKRGFSTDQLQKTVTDLLDFASYPAKGEHLFAIP